MADILSAITSIFGAAIGWVGDIAEMVTQQTVAGTFDYPLLLLFVIIPLVGLGVGLFRRLLNVN
ncbi:MAG: hypothetical protein GXY86_03130 [Firmicutes bacterium]|nr:hypothetical protein [Bacillota bacterium]